MRLSLLSIPGLCVLALLAGCGSEIDATGEGATGGLGLSSQDGDTSKKTAACDDSATCDDAATAATGDTCCGLSKTDAGECLLDFICDDGSLPKGADCKCPGDDVCMLEFVCGDGSLPTGADCKCPGDDECLLDFVCGDDSLPTGADCKCPGDDECLLDFVCGDGSLPTGADCKCPTSDACVNDTIACVSAQQLCEETGGTWDPNSCGHYTCQGFPFCDAVIPGCDCGSGKVFVEGSGCTGGC